MEYAYLKALDEYFCEQYSDYVRIAAIEGYKMPEMIALDRDGNIYRRESEQMRLSKQSEKENLLKRFKERLVDTDFTFDFAFPSFRDKFRDRFKKLTFAKYLPGVLKKYDLTPKQAGERLTTEPVIFAGILKGRLYPEKNLIMALALVCRMNLFDVNNLFALCGFELKKDNVRDVVFEYILTQKIFNEEMMRRCLEEYKIDSIPIKFEDEDERI